MPSIPYLFSHYECSFYKQGSEKLKQEKEK